MRRVFNKNQTLLYKILYKRNYISTDKMNDLSIYKTFMGPN